MGQLEDFRASLKRKDSAVSSEGEIPVKSIAKAKQENMNDTIQEMMRVYYKKYPEAKEFVDKFCE